MSIYKRGDWWWTKFQYCGVKVKCSTRTMDRREAEAFEVTEKARIFRAQQLGDRGTKTFREIAERWIAKTKGADRSRLNWFLEQPEIADIEISQVTDDLVEQLEFLLRQGTPGRFEQLRRDGSSYARKRSDSTINRHMCVLRTILNFAKKRIKGLEVPFVEVERTDETSKAKSALTPEEFERLFAELPEHLQNPLLFAVATGLRTGSVLSMTWDRIRGDGKQYFVPANDLKGRQGDGGFPLNEMAQAALQAARTYAPPRKPTDHIFQYRDPTLNSLTDMQMREVARGLLVQTGAVTQRDLRRALKRKFGRIGGTPRRQRICQEEAAAFASRVGNVARINRRAEAAVAGVAITRPLRNLDGTALAKAVARAGLAHKNVTPHTLRHTFATWLINQGASDRDLMALGNWKTPSMMRHYAYIRGDTLAPAAALIPTLKLERKGGLKLLSGGADAQKSGTKVGTER